MARSPTRLAPSLLWSRLLAGRLAWQMGGGTVRVLRVRWNQHARQADRTRPHRHPFHQVLYYSRGRGTQHLGELRRPIAPGSICFIAAGVAHSFLGTGPRPATCLALDFELEEVDHRSDHHDDDAVVLRNALRAGEREVFPLSARFQRQVEACMRRINRETEVRQTGYATAVQGMLLELLALFLRATRQTPAFVRSHPPPRWRNEGVVRRAVALAAEVPEEVEAEAPTLARAAREVGVSPNHLNRLLRQQTGLTFRQLLIQRRIELAKTLLRTGDAQCTEIAMSCGFGDSNYFARLFKRKTGLSPTEFRRRAR
jgi:AraC-like DNA-binding protein/mannose-6-phosphate isomerase-like protein (cupin superfamily)